jgi:glycolate oxidase FAD binding subunit
VVKNVAGYDLTKLFVGSFGTLGVIVEVACKLRPVPEAEKTCLLTSESLAPLAETLSRLARSELLPISVELLDAQALSQCAAAPAPAQWGLLARFGESAEAVAYQTDRLARLASDRPEISFIPLDDEAAAHVWQAVGEFEARFGAEVTLRLGVLPAQTAPMVETCSRLLKPGGPRFAIIAHAANGVVRVFIKHVGESASARQRVAQSIAELRAILGRQGSLALERAPIALKGELGVWGDAPETAPLLRGLKEKFDPKRTLNPGRFVAGI